jgi:hypothetical protein
MNPPLGGANAIWSGYVEGGGRGVESPWPLSARGAGLFSVTLKGPERACAAAHQGAHGARDCERHSRLRIAEWMG